MDKCKYFGTDGIRGLVGQFPITVDFLPKLGWSIGRFILKNNHAAKVLIGKDTRISGYLIEAAISAGIMSTGVNVYRLGVLPTPGIAYLTRTFRADIGIVISASHNPYHDNGIKFFTTDGYKLSKDQELTIEQLIESPMDHPNPLQVGKAYALNDAQGRYIEYCKSAIPHKTDLRRFKIVLDCANGSTYHIAPFVLAELGADVISLNIKPNGTNININGGTDHIEKLRKNVLEQNADLGIAFDGDGDRVKLIDHQGEMLDGDEVLYIILRGLLAVNRFRGGVVGTLMSNTGLELAVQNLGIHFIRTSIGDHHIVETLMEKNWLLGGEPSGHIVYLPVNTTGDGIVAALQVLQTMIYVNEDLNMLKKGMNKFYQKLINLPYQQALDLNSKHFLIAKKNIEAQLKGKGRVLVRYSGTEPVLRILVEGEDIALVDQLAENLAAHINTIMINVHDS